MAGRRERMNEEETQREKVLAERAIFKEKLLKSAICIDELYHRDLTKKVNVFFDCIDKMESLQEVIE